MEYHAEGDIVLGRIRTKDAHFLMGHLRTMDCGLADASSTCAPLSVLQ